ncbi:hypothetical protein F5B20DRAFT_563202 [Whalleya microplaca]|nr:hypothetical protein F5B20DRAFT_563202 [Whalleya microplaca]
MNRNPLEDPVLLYLQFWGDDSTTAAGNRPLGRVSYTHESSTTKCVILNSQVAFDCVESNKDVIRKWRPETLYGERHAKVYPMYNIYRQPIDFHFLENYFYRTIDHRDLVSSDEPQIWWPNIIVRLDEVYEVMTNIQQELGGMTPDGVSHFFGFFGRWPVRLQEFWILADPKETGEDYHKEKLPASNSNEPLEIPTTDPREKETYVSLDVMDKKMKDIAPIYDLNSLSPVVKERVRQVASYIEAGGDSVPVQPRLVRWRLPYETTEGRPLTLSELTHMSNQRDMNNAQGHRRRIAALPRWLRQIFSRRRGLY